MCIIIDGINRDLRHASMCLSDNIARSSLALYAALKFRPANPLQYTVLSTFTLVRTDREPVIKPVSLGTGVKCLPESRLAFIGDTVHDSHAEILARRGFVRWLLSELCAPSPSEWIEHKSNGKWSLRKNVSLHMYTSALPCETLASPFPQEN
jgi:tRNA-specific adenosine deaminase 1